MQPEYYPALEAAALAIGLTPHLQEETDHYRFEVEWEQERPSLGEALSEYWDRHENDRKVGWLDAASVKVLKRAFIDAGIAQHFDREGRYHPSVFSCTGGDSHRVWFRFEGKSYIYDPD